MREFIRLDRSPTFLLQAQRARLIAPIIRASAELLTALSERGMGISTLDDPMLEGLKEVRPRCQASIALDIPVDSSPDRAQVLKRLFNGELATTTIQVPLEYREASQKVAVNREVNTGFWLGVLVGDALANEAFNPNAAGYYPLDEFVPQALELGQAYRTLSVGQAVV